MNAVFELEVNSFRKPVKDFASLSYLSGQIVPQNSPAVAETISIVIGSWQGNSKLVFRITTVITILNKSLRSMSFEDM